MLEWVQLGADIDGAAAGDNFGSDVSLSSDGYVLAVGSKLSDTAGVDSGEVRVYEYALGSGEWIQKGLAIHGEAADDRSGSAVSLSGDGSRIAVGADRNDGSGANAGHVRVFEYTLGASDWVQLGSDIDGEMSVDLSGRSVSISEDGTRVAIGANHNDGAGISSGHVRVFEFSAGGNVWIQVGSDIDGEAANDQSGVSVSLSLDGSVLAVGAFLNDGAGSNAGHVRVFQYDGGSGAWLQLGGDINGALTGDKSGFVVALSDAGKRVAVSSHLSDVGGTDAGLVRVFEFQETSTSWVQLGPDVVGERPGDLSGWSLSLSGSGERVAVGAQANEGGGIDAGHVRVYQYEAELDNWEQLGSDLDGDAAGDNSGVSVSLSRDGQRVAIGAPMNDGNGTDSGHVKVFQIPFHPSGQPTGEPSSQPSRQPTCIPTATPSGAPSSPSSHPSGDPSSRPSPAPTGHPSLFPTGNPSESPTGLPSGHPTLQPSVQPSCQPTGQPSIKPSCIPTNQPTGEPSVHPSSLPSGIPASVPSCEPSSLPSCRPSGEPSSIPSSTPSKMLEWVQLGADIDGAAAGDNFGSDVSLSSDGYVLAVGSKLSDTAGVDSGEVRVYEYVLGSGEWIQKGLAIHGEAADDRSGSAVSLSGDGSRIAVGADRNDGSGANAGHVRVFEYTLGASDWVQLGSDIDGEMSVDLSGRSVSISEDGTRVAIGANHNDGAGISSGHVRVFEFSAGGNVWIQVGSDIDGEAANDQSGVSVSLSLDGSVLAVGAFLNDGAGSNAGHVRVFQYDGGSGAWLQLGGDINGALTGDKSGFVVALSDAGKRVAVSSHLSDVGGTDAGLVRVFEFQETSTSWVQLGPDVVGERPGDLSGWSLSLSGSGERVAVGAQANEGGGIDAGHVRVYQYEAELDNWEQLGSDLDGDAAGDNSGVSVSLSRDGQRVAIGAPMNDGNGTDSGHVKVFQIPFHPSGQPTGEPSSQPSRQPTCIPTATPSGAPSSPSSHPSGDPSSRPSPAPTGHPSLFPTGNPSESPTGLPSGHPTLQPSVQPSCQPTGQPSIKPSCIPTNQPTGEPSVHPSSLPSGIPASVPSCEPSSLPSCRPSGEPSSIPSSTPSKMLEWVQLGADIDGAAAGDNFGSDVSLSSDGYVLAVGSKLSDTAGVDSGEVRVYEYVLGSGEWIQKGLAIHGEAADDRSGSAVSLSGDGSRIAVGADRNDGSGANAGHVRVFEYTLGASDWVQLGSDIDGEMSVDLSGRSVSLSEDGTRVAIGANHNDGAGISSGHVRVFEFSAGGNVWIQVGSDIDGEAANDQSGVSVSLSLDGSVLAVGAFLNDGAGSNAGHVRVFQYDGGSGAWLQLGGDINGALTGDKSGFVVALSDAGKRVAVSSHLSDVGGTDAGLVRVFEFQETSTSWVQLGPDVVGERPGDLSGWSLSLSGSGERVAVGAQANEGGGIDAGHVRVYQYEAELDNWEQLGSDLDGDAAGDNSGVSVSLSRDGQRVAIGAPMNDGNGTDSGHVKVFQIPFHPSGQPTGEPSSQPSRQPTCIPTATPSGAPSSPSSHPSGDPSSRPSPAPTGHPSLFPTGNPSESPTGLPSGYPTLPPSVQPSCQPTGQPSIKPSCVPTNQPTGHPRALPTRNPSESPSGLPSGHPTLQPSVQPSCQPTGQPSIKPTCVPTNQPTGHPRALPTRNPSESPSGLPSGHPTLQPSVQPSCQPTGQPSIKPSCVPTNQPTGHPHALPTRIPSESPSSLPSGHPTLQPSVQPSCQPTGQPSIKPSCVPTNQPTGNPRALPTRIPSESPSGLPSGYPTLQPSVQPSCQPTGQPSIKPSCFPTNQPTGNPRALPTRIPSESPSGLPSGYPTLQPTVQPSCEPTGEPSVPTGEPSYQPSSIPSLSPVGAPSSIPSDQPSVFPTTAPSVCPSGSPTAIPVVLPSESPSLNPFSFPTSNPSLAPISFPTTQPTCIPSIIPTFMPSPNPTSDPSGVPSQYPSCHPSISPNFQPSSIPSSRPFVDPSSIPSFSPSSRPSARPTAEPSPQPTGEPSVDPSSQPSSTPFQAPSMIPTCAPFGVPSVRPVSSPSSLPTEDPSAEPSSMPSQEPTSMPTGLPSKFPSFPSEVPSAKPSKNPSSSPSSIPSAVPSLQPMSVPSGFPSCIPSVVPSLNPSLFPSSFPSEQPSDMPTWQPSSGATNIPFGQPSHRPFCAPTNQPSSTPSALPSRSPSTVPSYNPSEVSSPSPTLSPSEKPSGEPTAFPSSPPPLLPSSRPTTVPTTFPSTLPTEHPSCIPSNFPSSSCPSYVPSLLPSGQPTYIPFPLPSTKPSCEPSAIPSPGPTLQPTPGPSGNPSLSPSGQPSGFLSSLPSKQPSWGPTNKPSTEPSGQPSRCPFSLPTKLPTSEPTAPPSFFPTCDPSWASTGTPTLSPSGSPSGQPTTGDPTTASSMNPTTSPSCSPSSFPSACPVTDPSGVPSTYPSDAPTSIPFPVPSCFPTATPSAIPSWCPSSFPSCTPSLQPTTKPSAFPSVTPSGAPTNYPSHAPSCSPTLQPTGDPTAYPTSIPTKKPSGIPSPAPSCYPTIIPSANPSNQPSVVPSSTPSEQPLSSPTDYPSVTPFAKPSCSPSGIPSRSPSSQPSSCPSSVPSAFPSTSPSLCPLANPTNCPSQRPSAAPSCQPTAEPSKRPSTAPSKTPNGSPSVAPTSIPKSVPSSCPTGEPWLAPTTSPGTSSPTKNGDTNSPTRMPTAWPTVSPTQQPSSIPTCCPSHSPSSPSAEPSTCPSVLPTRWPSSFPTSQPSQQPSTQPSNEPSGYPSKQPSGQPSIAPSKQPSSEPSEQPSALPSREPSHQPSGDPTNLPSSKPSHEPSGQPTSQPSNFPSRQPSGQPSGQPSCRPTAQPSGEPSLLPSSQPSGRPSSTPTSSPTSIPTLSFYTLFDSSTIEFPPMGELSFAYHINAAADFSVVNQEWVEFIDNFLRVPFELDYTLTEIWISGVSYGDIEPWVVRNLSCEDKLKVTPIVDSLTSLDHTNVSVSCNNISLGAASGGDFCVNCGHNRAGDYRCFDPKNGTFSLPSYDFCSNWEWDNRITKHAVALIFEAQERVKFTVPSIEEIILLPRKNSILVSAYTYSRGGGTLYCNAFNTLTVTDESSITRSVLRTKGYAAPILERQGDAPLQVNITISELTSASEYAVYCHVEDTSGNMASVDDLMETRRVATTRCCRKIQFTQVSKYLTKSSSLESVLFAYKIPSFPEIGLAVSVTPFLSRDLNGFENINVMPKSFTFTDSNRNLGRVRVFALSAPLSVTNGIYQLRLNVSEQADNSQLQHRYEAPDPIEIEVIGGSSPFPPPLMSSATFSNSGQSVLVCFDSATDYGVEELGNAVNGAWLCNRVFSFHGADVTSCTWTSDTCVKLIFCGNNLCSMVEDRSSLTLLEPGDSIVLKSSVIKSACKKGSLCSLNLFANMTTVTVAAPLLPLQPDVFVAASEAGGACRLPLTLDASATSGSAGRQWKMVRWSVSVPDSLSGESASDSQEVNFSMLADYLNSLGSISSPITIPYNMLNHSTYKFTLTVANFLQSDDSEEFSSSVDAVITDPASSTTPFVYFDGLFYRTVRAFDDFSVVASSVLPSCVSSSVVTYSWKVYKGTTYAPQIKSLSSDARKMKLNAYTLKAGHTYTFLVKAIVDNGGVGSAILTVFVEPGSVYVTIAGASSLIIPHRSPLVLDASSSVFEDLSPFDPQNIVPLTWSCVVTAVFSNMTGIVYGDSCDEILQLNVSAGATPSTVLVPVSTDMMVADVEYSVTASAVTAAGDDVATTISVQSLAPVVILPTLSISSSFRKFTSNKILQIFGLIDSPLEALPQNVSWQLLDDGGNFLDLEPLLLTTNKRVVQPNNSYSFPLSAKPFSFTPGKTYNFRLQAVSDDSITAFSQISLTVNGPPTSGDFEVVPDVGVALDTVFFFNAPFWMEDASDYPISYNFRYTIQRFQPNSSDLTFMNIGFSSQHAFRTSQLPPGLSVFNHSVHASVIISDFYGSSTDSETNMTVYDNPAFSGDAVTRRLASYNLSNSMNEAISNGDVDAVSIEVNNAIAVLVAVDCAGVSNCDVLYNRMDCFFAAHTCGECLKGYSGDVGSANSRCWLDAEFDAIVDSNVTNCTSSDEFDTCAPPHVCVNSKCIIPPKSCPSATFVNESCSNHGKCLFFDTSNGNLLDNCTVDDSSCTARCSCDADYYGSACDLSVTEFEERLITRDLLCKGLVFVGESIDDSVELLSSLTAGLQLAFNPNEVLSDDSLMTCLKVVKLMVNMSDFGYLPNEPFFVLDGSAPPQQAMLNFASNLLEYFLVISSSNGTEFASASILMALDDVTTLVNSLVSSVSSNMVGGEADVDMMSVGYRVSVKYISQEDLQNATLTPPFKYLFEQSHSITLPPHGMKACEDYYTTTNNEGGGAEFVRLSLSTWQKNPYIIGLGDMLSINDTLSSGIFRFSSIGSEAGSVVEIGNAEKTNYTLTLQLNGEHAWNDTNDYPGVVTFLADGSTGNAPCVLDDLTPTSLTFTCFNLLDFCPEIRSLNTSSTTGRRLELGYQDAKRKESHEMNSTSQYNFRFEMGRGGISESCFAAGDCTPPIYPDHPHYALWSSLNLQKRSKRRLDFDYAGEGDDDTSGTVTFSDYGALTTSAANEINDNLFSSPVVFTTSQGMAALIGIGITVGLLFVRWYYFVVWDRRDRDKKYVVPEGKKVALMRLNKCDHFLLRDNVLDIAYVGSDDESAANGTNRRRKRGAKPGLATSHAFRVRNRLKSLYSEESIDEYGEVSADDENSSSHESEESNKLAMDNTAYRKIMKVEVKVTRDKMNVVSDMVEKFIESTVPAVFLRSSKSGWQRFLLAVYRQHDLVRCFTFASRRLPRSIRFLIVITKVLLIAFVDALFYGILFVDDGYCESLSGEDNLEVCEEQPSQIQSGISKCYFDETTYKCSLRPPPSDIRFFLVVSMIVTLLSIVPAVFCEFLLEKICARAPSFSQNKLADSKYMMNLGELRRNAKDSLMSYITQAEDTGNKKASRFIDDMNTEDITPLSNKELRMQEIYSYMDVCSLEEEVNQLFASAKSSIEYNLASRAMPWEVRTLSTDDGVHRAEALKLIIGLYDDGSPVPLSLYQKLVFGTARKRLEWKTKKVRKQVQNMMEDIDVFMKSDQGCVDNINAYLIQSFILEQLSPFRRYAIKDEFFQFDSANPAPIDGFTWICCWTFLIILWIFLIYWCLLWAIQNSRITAMAWIFQVVFVLVQEFCVNENVQILIMNVILVETMRSQVKRITDILTSILISKVGNTNEKTREEGFNVAQHMTASCRLARKAVLSNLVASKILTQLNDHDIAKCREVRLTRIGFWTKMLITIPTMLALSHETVQECILDVIIPTMWCCFVLANAILWGISPLAMLAPYIGVILLLLFRYCYVIPKRRRRQQYRKEILEQNKAGEATHATSSVDQQDMEENIWRNMNLSLNLVSKVHTLSHSESIALSATSSGNFSSCDNRRKCTFEEHSFTPLQIPDEIGKHKVKLSEKDKDLYDTNETEVDYRKTFLNKHLWKVDTKLPTPGIWNSSVQDSRFEAMTKLKDDWSLIFAMLGGDGFEDLPQWSRNSIPLVYAQGKYTQPRNKYAESHMPSNSLEGLESFESLESFRSMRSFRKTRPSVIFEEPAPPSVTKLERQSSVPSAESFKPHLRSALKMSNLSQEHSTSSLVSHSSMCSREFVNRGSSRSHLPAPTTSTSSTPHCSNVDFRLQSLSSRYLSKKVNSGTLNTAGEIDGDAHLNTEKFIL